MNWHSSYDKEVSAKPAVQINTMKVTLNFIVIGHVRTINRRGTHNRETVILLAIQCDIGTDFQAADFCRPAGILVRDGLKNA